MKIGFSVLILILSGCANPMASLEPEINQFKKDHAENIKPYAGASRTMRVASSGDASLRPVVFVHGSPGSWEGWIQFLNNETLQKKFHLIAVDRPGYGGSGLGKTETSLKNQSNDIAAALQINRSQKPAILVGHSYGGPVIARMAMDHPSQVAGLVFVASSVDPELEEIKWVQYPGTWWPIRVLIPSELRVCNEEIFPLKNELVEMLPLWKSIHAKSVFIQGDQDDLVPPKNIDFLENHLSQSDIVKSVRVPGLNHFVPWKRPELISDAIVILDQRIDSTSAPKNQETL